MRASPNLFRGYFVRPVSSRDCEDQSDSSWLGELLSGRSFEFLFFKGQTVGRNEGPETSGTCPGAQRLSLEAAE